jgi:hypothetical protein
MPTVGYTELHGDIVAETSKAILFEIRYVNQVSLGTVRREWFPLSYVKSIYKAKEEDKETGEDADLLVVADWLIQKKGLA